MHVTKLINPSLINDHDTPLIIILDESTRLDAMPNADCLLMRVHDRLTRGQLRQLLDFAVLHDSDVHVTSTDDNVDKAKAVAMALSSSNVLEMEPTAEYRDVMPDMQVFDDCVDTWDYVPEPIPEESLLSHATVIGTDGNDIDQQVKALNVMGHKARADQPWEGPIPPESFINVSPNVRMSTPEYMFLRKANTLPLPEAVLLGLELCGHYATTCTTREMPDDEYDYVARLRTTVERMSRYLKPICDTKEGHKAMVVLSNVSNGASSPLAAWLSMVATLPTTAGGLAMRKPEISLAAKVNGKIVPYATGPCLAYDLLWRVNDNGVKAVALQHVRTEELTDDVTGALEADGNVDARTISCEQMNAKDVAKLLSDIATTIGSGTPIDTVPDDLMALMPTYANMMTTPHDISEHM